MIASLPFIATLLQLLFQPRTLEGYYRILRNQKNEMNKRQNIFRVALGGVLFLALVGGIIYLAKPTSTPKTQSDKLQVVAAENFWGNIAEQLGGNEVQVTSIITDPSADPHLYESNAQDASQVTNADVVIVNGLGYDDFMAKLLSASSNTNRSVLTAQQILNEPNGSNQHLWYNIPKVTLVASQITDAYIAKDPAHKSYYQHNLIVFNNSLHPLETTIDHIKQQYAGTPVAYTEPVPGYLLAAVSLDVKTPEGFAKSIEDGDDPSPSDTYTMDQLMINNSVKVLLYNAQATSPVTENVKALAKQHNIPVIGVTETLPANEKSYQAWMQDELNQLLAALGA
jgi:zinc/manganese transport system substrate-binding protein